MINIAVFGKIVSLISQSSTFGRRFISNSVANLFSVSSQFIIQIVSVPILIRALGLERYGVWLMLSTIPTYLILSDLGLVTAATNDMAIAEARGDHVKTKRVFQTVSAVVIALFTFVTMLVTFIVWATSYLAGVWSMSIAPHIMAIPLLTAYAAMCMISLLPVAVFKASGHYARGTFLFDICTLIEAFLIMGTAVMTHNIVATAAAPAIFRSCAMPLIYFHMRKLLPQFQFGKTHISLDEAKRLLPSALGLLAIPLGLGLSLQGTALIVGAILGPAALAIFVPVRTASRTPILVAGIISRAMVPEISGARGRGDNHSERRFWKLNATLTMMILIPTAVIFSVFGNNIISIWTGGKIVTPLSLINVMAVTIVVHGYWYLNTVLLTASHGHVIMSRFVLVVCGAGLAATAFFVLHWGITGAAYGLLLVDATLAFVMWMLHRKA